MDIEHFKYVLTLARLMSFSEASNEISMSQSSLSKHLFRIESELGGIRLFDRATRPIKLTEAGEEFILHAQRIVNDFETLKQAMQEYSVLPQANLVVGCIPVIARLGLTPLIVSFGIKYPKINIEIRERQNKELLGLLMKKEIDIAFITALETDKLNYPAINFYLLIEDEIILVTNQSNPLTKRPSIDLAETKNEGFFLLDADSGLYQICIHAFQKAGITPKIHEIRSVETIIDLVSKGLGVTLLTKRIAQSFKNPNLSLVPLNNSFTRITSLAVQNQPQLTLPVKTFIKHISEWVDGELELV